jgi:hypothetical protein
MTLPFTSDQFFEVFAAYNRALWPFALALWFCALAGALMLAAQRRSTDRIIPALLAVLWAWAALFYHAVFFTIINPAAWFFSLLFLVESALFVWSGVIHDRLRFSASGSIRHGMAWLLITYALAYPLLVRAEGHAFPALPTFGVPCPTTILTIGFLFAAEPPIPAMLVVIPIVWGAIGGSAAMLLQVRTDLMLGASAIALLAYSLIPHARRIRA